MPAWFDLLSLDPEGEEDEAGLKKSFALVSALVDEELGAGISAEHIFLGGFSQGGALALYSGLQLGKNKVGGGIVALSCWLPLHQQFG